jgi:hypothetical protein
MEFRASKNLHHMPTCLGASLGISIFLVSMVYFS